MLQFLLACARVMTPSVGAHPKGLCHSLSICAMSDRTSLTHSHFGVEHMIWFVNAFSGHSWSRCEKLHAHRYRWIHVCIPREHTINHNHEYIHIIYIICTDVTTTRYYSMHENPTLDFAGLCYIIYSLYLLHQTKSFASWPSVSRGIHRLGFDCWNGVRTIHLLWRPRWSVAVYHIDQSRLSRTFSSFTASLCRNWI